MDALTPVDTHGHSPWHFVIQASLDSLRPSSHSPTGKTHGTLLLRVIRLNIARVFSDKCSVFPAVAFTVLSRLISDENERIRKQALKGIEKLVWDFPDYAY